MMPNAQKNNNLWDPERPEMEETGVVILWGLPAAGYDNSLECRAGRHGADTAGRCTPEKQLGTLSPSKTAGNLNQDQSVSVKETAVWADGESFSLGLETAWMLFAMFANHCQNSQNPGLNMGRMRIWSQKFPCFSQELGLDKGLICQRTSLPKV